jgi:hypothetical protein
MIFMVIFYFADLAAQATTNGTSPTKNPAPFQEAGFI